MRAIHGHTLLLVLQALVVSVRCQSVPDSPECLNLVLPQVQEFLGWERILRTSCGDGSQLLAGDLVEEQFESVPEALDNLGPGSPLSHEKPRTLEEHHTGSDQQIIQITRASTEIDHEQNQLNVDETAALVRSQSCSTGECAEHESRVTNSEKGADEIEHDHEQEFALTDQIRSVQASFEIYKDKVQLAMSSSIKSLLQNIDVPPADFSLWTTQHYVSAAGLLGSSLLVSLGSISVGKRLLNKSVTPRDESPPTTSEREDVPSDDTPESDSSPEKQHTPPSSNDQDSADGSTSPTLEQDPTHHTPRSRNEQNGTHQTLAPVNEQPSTRDIPPKSFSFFSSPPSGGEKGPSPAHTQASKDNSVEHEIPQSKGHDLLSPSGHHSTSKSVSAQESVDAQEESFNQEGNSSFVLVDKACSTRVSPDSHHTERHSENDKETVKSFNRSTTNPREPLSLETIDQQHANRQPLPRLLDQSTDETRGEAQVSATSGDSGLEHWLDVSNTKSRISSIKEVDYKSSERHGETDVVVGLDQHLDGTSREQRSKSTSRVTFKDDESHSFGDDEPMIDNTVMPDGQRGGGQGVEQATSSTNDGQERIRVRASNAYDTFQVQPSVPQSSEKNIEEYPAGVLESLDTILANQKTTGSNDYLATREVQRTEESPNPRSRAERAYISPTRSLNMARSPTASWSRKRWSSPISRREVVQPQHFPDSCPICRRNARLNANAGNEESESRTSSSTATAATVSTANDSQRQVDPSKSSSSSFVSPPPATAVAEEGVEEGEEKEEKRLSFRRTLSQVLSSSRSKSNTSLSSGSSSKKIDKVKSKFQIS